MNKILVTGSNGFVGKALCLQALLRGDNVNAATRVAYCLPKINNFVVGNIAESTNWSAPLKGCDVVIHLAARVHVMQETSADPLAEFRQMNVIATEHLARSAAAVGVKRFVFVSSIKVNGEETFNGQAYNEQMTPAPQDAYGVSKWEAEQVLHKVAKETGLDVVIVRPPLVYGAGVKGNFAQMISVVAHGVPLPFASVRNKRSLIYVKNLVDALILCATHPNAAGNTYLVSDCDDVSTSDLLRKLAFAMGKKPRLFLLPISLLRLTARMFKKSDQLARLLGSLQIDSTKIRRELGWAPPFSVDDGLKQTVRDKGK